MISAFLKTFELHFFQEKNFCNQPCCIFFSCKIFATKFFATSIVAFFSEENFLQPLNGLTGGTIKKALWKRRRARDKMAKPGWSPLKPLT